MRGYEKLRMGSTPAGSPSEGIAVCMGTRGCAGVAVLGRAWLGKAGSRGEIGRF